MPDSKSIVNVQVFVAGIPRYRIKPTEESLITKALSIVKKAFRARRSDTTGEKKAHWLDWAKSDDAVDGEGDMMDSHNHSLIEDLKLALRPCKGKYVFWRVLINETHARWEFEVMFENHSFLVLPCVLVALLTNANVSPSLYLLPAYL